MKSTFTFRFALLFLVIFSCRSALVAQQVVPPQNNDTLRIITIIQGNSLRLVNIDSVTSLQTIAGNVILKEGLTLFYCDSAAINQRTNIMEAFGHIHINQNDSIHTYSQYLKYVGADRMAFLKKDVRLTDNKGTLYTQELEYDLKTSIGKYYNGGRVVNGKTVLTSTEGVYYAETKDVYFKKNVHLTDPKYEIQNDTLLYNTQTQITSWNTPSIIKSKNGGDIYSSNGTYDLKNGKAFFGNRTIIQDSTRTYVADNSAYDEKSGIAQLEGNAIIKDSVNGYTILGGQIYLDKNSNSFLATRKPVLIFKGEGNDSTFVSGDTLFSGIERRDSLGRKISVKKDTLKTETVVNVRDSLPSKQERKAVVDSEFLVKNNVSKDSLLTKKTDSLTRNSLVQSNQLKDTVNTRRVDSSLVRQNIPDSNMAGKQLVLQKDTSKKTTTINIAKDTAIRYFIAFHHVRIFNDSLQAVCDSLYYSSEDSVFRLFQEPLVFSNKSQISGDTIYLYTKNKKADRLYVFENGIIINKTSEKMYNQFAGRTLNGYFKDGELDYIRAKGSPAESVFYPQDEDSSYIGMNRSKGDVIDIYFLDRAVNKVKFINSVDGTLFPIRHVPEDQKYLKNYKWLDKRRPKSKLELFE